MLDPSDGVFGRFDLAALCGCHTLNVCCCYRRFEAPDLHPYETSETLQELGLGEYKVDTFLSDYDDYVDDR